MNYLLDTNACIALINGTPARVRHKMQSALEHGNKLFVPYVVAFELWYGVFKSSRQRENAERIEMFFAGPIALLPFEQEDAELAGATRAMLESAGKPIGAYDLLIAGQALRHNMTLITADVSEFARVNGLLWQDWAKP